MFAWFSKRKELWTRRTVWTPLLQHQRAFQRTLSKERSRVERAGTNFGFIILRLEELTGARKQTIKLSKMLHRRLRDTDEKGHLGLGRVGILLPETDVEGTELVLNDLLKLAGQQDLKIDGEAFVYPDRETHDPQLDPREGGVRQPQELTNATPLASMFPDYPSWKRATDILFSTVGLAVLSPLFLLVAFAIRISSRGPVIFCQTRTGYLGKRFTIYKFRTMVANAEELKDHLRPGNERDGPAFKMQKDPRVTALGGLLRSTGLDELPQLVNVLRGDMALVGPRPLPVDEASSCLPWQKRREEVRPGLTCSWQIAKSRKMSFADWMRLDLSYARKISFGVDLKLIAKTVVSVFLGRVGH